MTTIDTTPTEPPRNWFLDIAWCPTEDLLNEATNLRAKLAIAQECGLRVDARAYELRLLDVERAIAIHNRRATEAEDQRQAEERPSGVSRLPSRVLHMLADYRRRLQAEPSSLPGYDQTEQEDRRRWIAEQIVRIDEVFAGQQLETVCEAPPQSALTADEVRAVVRAAMNGDDAPPRHASWCRAVEDRVAEKLAGRVVIPPAPDHVCPSPVGLTQPDRVRLQRVRDLLRQQPVHWDLEEALLDRLLAGAPEVNPAQREADLREAFGAGAAWREDRPAGASGDIQDPHPAAAEYARSKAGG